MSYHGYEVYDPEYDEWRDIPGFPGYYISSSGHVWGPGRYGEGQIMHPTPIGKCGHLDVCLRRNGIKEHRFVHRLVAQAFIPNPYNYPIVRHLDDDPLNNNVNNLEWGTMKDNMRDCIRNGNFRYLTEDDIKKANEVRSTPTTLINLKNGETYDFDSQTEAAEFINVDQSCVSDCCRGCRSHIGIWKAIKTDEFDESDLHYIRNLNKYRKRARIKATNIETGEIYIFDGQTRASEYLNISVASISNVLSGKIDSAKHWTFEYEEDYND